MMAAAAAAAAVSAAGSDAAVELLEKNEKCGKKIYITGKGRCNLTNNCSREEFLEHVISNPRFLFGALSRFDSQAVMAFFEENGTKVKTERGNRVFPVTDHASDVTAALLRRMRELGVKVSLDTEVKRLLTEPVTEADAGLETESDAGFEKGSDSGLPEETPAQSEEKLNSGLQVETHAGLRTGHPAAPQEKKTPADGASGGPEASGAGASKRTQKGRTADIGKGGPERRVTGVETTDGRILHADAVIVATGGLSYPSTGSTGDGYRFAGDLGLKVTDCRPSLVPMETEGSDAQRMQGLSLRNVRIRIRDGKKTLFEDFGEMMFTHFGVTGPLILSASAVTGAKLARHPLTLEINLKSALSREQLDARFLREFGASPNKKIGNVLGNVFPAKMIPVMLERCQIPEDLPANSVSRQQRQRLVEETEAFTLKLTRLRGYTEAVVTSGGVSTKEIRPDTMETKKIRGLFFAGEVLDVDAMTGGFNLQIAWSTGFAAGTAAASDTSALKEESQSKK